MPSRAANPGKEENVKHWVKDLRTGEIVEVYFRHADGVAYIGKNGVVILYRGQYEEID